MRNELKPFAIGVGANVLTPAEWSADATRTVGFVAGVAPSEKVNTAWRQTAFCSAMIGQFTVNGTGLDVLDDGNVDEFERRFREAIRRTGNSIDGPLRPYFISVTSASVSAPPFNPESGAVYLIPAGASGIWAGLQDFVVQWTGKNWVYVSYPNGSLLGVADSGDMLIRSETGTWRSWYATLQEALTGTSKTTVITPATMKYVFDVRLPKVTDSSYPPTNPIPGDCWKDTDLDVMFQRIVDGSQHIWLQYTL
jgi:hypothetical protein